MSENIPPVQVDRIAEPVDADQTPRLPFPIVGIGASAGGLEAFLDFFQALPADTGMAFVLIQHLSPDKESLLADILRKHTPLPVHEIRDGLPVEPNHVYVIRPGQTLLLKNCAFHLGAPVQKPGHGRPVDDFFRSLAEEQVHLAVGVIMSGMGSNGTAGAQSIKAVGGLLIAQDPDTAKFPSMPLSLMDAGLADMVLPPKGIPEVLIRFARHPYASSKIPTDAVLREERRHFNEILAILRSRTRKDFTGYKKPTVLRRVERRMGLNQILSLMDYTHLVRQNPIEASALADDLLIHVTGFFRDPDAWEALRQRIVVPLVTQRDADSPLRCWVAACSSGEEAFTLAILLLETCQQLNKRLDIKIFATDTADRTLVHARNGVYPMGIESEIPPAILERYFDREEPNFRIKKEVREMVVFAPQNILQDPPFSRLDICSCRNLLIYLQPEMQTRVIALLHFGLREGGTLFLGNSETVGPIEGLFEPVDKKFRIYRRLGPTRHGAVEFPLPRIAVARSDRRDGRTLPAASLAQITADILLEKFTPPAVVVDRHQRIVFFHGDTSPFLDQPRGEPTSEILAVAREFIRGTLRAAIVKAGAENQSVTVQDGILESPTGRRRVSVTAAPVAGRLGPGHLLITFHLKEEAPLASSLASEKSAPNDQLRDDLQRTRDELQHSVEDLQTANEELKAANEELTSVNEEYQSSNEELETSKEELQSLNEELSTVNSQLQAKMDEHEALTNDLNSLLASSAIAVIFLDSQFCIRRYTPAMRELMDIIPSDVGRPLRDLARRFTDPDLLADARLVLEKLVPIERNVAAESNRWFLRRALPYRTADDRIAGVVVTFVDITEPRVTAIRHAELLKSELAARQQTEAAMRIKDEFLAVLGHELRTPLSAVMLWVKMLRGSHVQPAELNEGLDAISRSIETQNRLIEDLLDTSRIAAGKLRMEFREVDLAVLLGEIAETAAAGARARDITVNLRLDPDLRLLRADPTRLRQVFWNLINNALKFTPPGGRVDVESRRDNGFIEIRVVDNGRGISPEFLPHVFEPFRQAESATSRVLGGLGLGLAICRQLVELHGGSIAAFSEGEGRGAVFTVRLPAPAMEPASQSPPVPSPAAADLRLLHEKRVLLAEDNVETRTALTKLLKCFGCTVDPAKSAEEALALFNQHRPDILLSDIGLPETDGYALINQIRKIEAAAGTPPVLAVALTAFARDEDRRKVMRSGFHHFLSKPIEPDSLLGHLATFLSNPPPTK